MTQPRRCNFALLALALVASAQQQNCEDAGCTSCRGGSGWQCSACQEGYTLRNEDHYGLGQCVEIGRSCEITQEETEDWFGRILIGSIIGTLVTVITTTVGSLPVCCGIAKEMPLRMVAFGIGAVAAFFMFVPLIAGKVTTDSVIADHCEECRCTDQDEKDAKDYMSSFGVYVAYVHAMGWLVLIFGGVTLCLSCCMCCPCCGPLQEDYLQAQMARMNAAQGEARVQGQVVGMPVTNEPASKVAS